MDMDIYRRIGLACSRIPRGRVATYSCFSRSFSRSVSLFSAIARIKLQILYEIAVCDAYILK